MTDDLDKWEIAIGKLILSCSRVEYEIIRLYEKWLPNRSYHSDDYFGRFDKAIGVAKTKLENGQEISEKLVEMRKYAKFRHLIAHNPVHYSNESEEWEIFDLKNEEESVNFSCLVTITQEIYELSVKLAVLLRVNV